MLESLISPLLGLWTSFKRPTAKKSVVAIVFVFFILGFYMTTNDSEADLYRYLESVKKHIPLSQVITELSTFNELDLYVPLSTSIISSLTSNGHVLMGWYGIIYGLFLGLSLTHFNNNRRIIDTILVVCFFSVMGFNGLAGVRYSTAFFVFFYGAIGFLRRREFRYLILVISSLLFHFAFALNVVLFFLYLLVKERPWVVWVIFILSFGAQVPFLGNIISSWGSGIGGAAEARALSYSSEAYSEMLADSQMPLNWFVRYKEFLVYVGLVIFSIVFFFRRKKLTVTHLTLQIVLLFLLLFSIRNIVINIPDLGVRTEGQCLCIAAYMVYLIYHDNVRERAIRFSTYLFSASFILIVLFCARSVIDYIPVFDLIVSPLITFPLHFL